MKAIKILVFVFFSFGTVYGQPSSSIKINYKFPEIPIDFFYLNNGDILIVDGCIFNRFDYKGNLIGTKVFCSKIKDIDFINGIIPVDTCSFYGNVHGREIYIHNGNIKYLSDCNCYVSLKDAKNILWGTNQIYDKEKNRLVNTICFFNNGICKNYPQRYDYASLNIELINDTIMFAGVDNYFYQLPIDTLKSLKRTFIQTFKEINDRVWFLGIEKNMFVFKYNDFKNERKDVILFFNQNLEFVSKKIVKHTIIENASCDPNFLFDTPSGLIYKYNPNDGYIYVLMNLKNGVYINKLNDLLEKL